MSVQAAGSQGAYSYLQSLLQQQSGITSGQAPLQTLLDAFYPTSDSSGASAPTSTSTAAPASSPSSTPTFSPDTLGALISLQGTDPVAAKAQSIFAGLDANGDGSVSKSEFESAFGPGADTTKVDALFNALDTNSDGSVSQSELTSAAETSHAHHHHHAHGGGGSGGGNGDGLNALMASLSGANSQTTNNADGSTSTTITYADGSSVVFNSAAASAASNGSAGGGTGQQTAQFNMLEKLIQMQSQLISAPDGLSNSTLLSI